MRGGGTSKITKRKIGKPRNPLTSKLKVKHNKFTDESKAKRKQSLQQWKQKLLESVLQLLGDPQFNNAEIENDLLYFQDLDLAVFGMTHQLKQPTLGHIVQYNVNKINPMFDVYKNNRASRDEYKSFATQLQKEYVHMDENTYKNMRLKMMQAQKANGSVTSPQSMFLRNIRNHSTPVIGNGAANSRLGNSNKKKGRKRKSVNATTDIIDLTPKRYRTTSNDSDIQIVEPEPPAIIDLVTDDTYNCNALTTVNATADTVVATSDCQDSENKSADDVVNVIVDSIDSTNSAESSNEVQLATETDQTNAEPVPLYVVCKDATANDSIKPPLYDLVSDDSFCFDSPYTTPVSSQNFSLSRSATTPTQSEDISQNKTLTNDVDDSVVFVSETLHTPKRVPPAGDFIPINANIRRPVQTFQRVPRADDYIPINNGGRSKNSKRKKSRSPLANPRKRRSPKSTQRSTNNEIPATETSATSTNRKPVSGIKRMVLIDGNNVGFAHSNNKFFSVEGLEICLKYFLDRGYDAKAIVPQMRLKKSRSSNPDLLAKLESEGRLVFSPCKNLPSGQKIISYDDRFILDFAVDCDAAVISNDNYRDLSKESEKYQDVINTRVIGFTFLNDFIHFPKDPYGKFGPSLTDILNGKEK